MLKHILKFTIIFSIVALISLVFPEVAQAGSLVLGFLLGVASTFVVEIAAALLIMALFFTKE